MQRSEGRGLHGREQQVPRPWIEDGLGLFMGKEENQCIWDFVRIKDSGWRWYLGRLKLRFE